MNVMKWVFGITHKYKAALILFAVMAIILANNLWERSNLAQMNESCSTIYKDRLVPAVYVVHLTDQFYKKRLIVEGKLRDQNHLSDPGYSKELEHHNMKIDSLLSDFNQTYLVDAETDLLKNLRDELTNYNDLEKQMITKAKLGEVDHLTKVRYTSAFSQIKNELMGLTSIQLSVGEEEHQKSMSNAAQANLSATIEVVMLILLGVIIQALIFASKTLGQKENQKHFLN
jgi:hypothetical protein